MSSVSNSAGALCVLSVLGPYAALASRGHGSVLDPNRLFTIVTTVNLLSGPLNILGQFLPNIFAAYASIKRIESFLLFEEKEEDETDDKSVSTEEKPNDPLFSPIKMIDASFAWTSDSEPFLKNVNIELDPGKLHLCIGSVASVSTDLPICAVYLELNYFAGKITPLAIYPPRNLYAVRSIHRSTDSNCLRLPRCPYSSRNRS